MHAIPGSWLRDAGGLFGLRVGIAGVHILLNVTGMALMITRLPVEDEFLHKHFGKEWEEYARRVSYRMIPGII